MSATEIRFHGRGGQGAVLAAKMLASACAAEGKCVASFPMYGFERRGMPVIDPTLLALKNLFDGLKPEGVLILNGAKPLDTQPHPNLKKAGIVNATQIALCEIGRDIPNTCLIGALAKVTGWVGLDSVLHGLGDYLEGDMLQRNIRNAERGYHEVEVTTW
jgi:Pyruvate/2-oxoacid:ferredoxin oxidoreductase gamma subunit